MCALAQNRQSILNGLKENSVIRTAQNAVRTAWLDGIYASSFTILRVKRSFMTTLWWGNYRKWNEAKTDIFLFSKTVSCIALPIKKKESSLGTTLFWRFQTSHLLFKTQPELHFRHNQCAGFWNSTNQSQHPWSCKVHPLVRNWATFLGFIFYNKWSDVFPGWRKFGGSYRRLNFMQTCKCVYSLLSVRCDRSLSVFCPLMFRALFIPSHTTKYLHSPTFVLNCVMFMFRGGGLGNSVFFFLSYSLNDTCMWRKLLYRCRRFMKKVFKYITEIALAYGLFEPLLILHEKYKGSKTQ